MTGSTTLWLAAALCAAASLYTVCAALAMLHLGSRAQVRAAARAAREAGASAPVSVLKPLCGAEPRLYENLSTFCEQHHPAFQLVFGVSSPSDPAIAVVERLKAAYPHCDIELVVDPRVYGSNLKVSNLINMAARARHPVFVIADSDIAVEPDYLRIVTAPLADPRNGIVTCLYRAVSIGGFWPRVGALFINGWFAPSVRVAHAAGSRAFGFGSTLALTRATLERVGGFAALKDCLADDYVLADYVRRLGLATVLAPMLVDTDVVEQRFAPLWLRETRWLRTIRSVNPAGFASLPITFAAPWLALGALLWGAHALDGGGDGVVFAVLGASTVTGIIARIVVHARGSAGFRAFWHDLPLAPLRDALCLAQWLAAAFGAHVMWRGARVPVANPVANPVATQVVQPAAGGSGADRR